MGKLAQNFSESLSIILSAPAWLVSLVIAMGYLLAMSVNSFCSISPHFKWYLWQISVPGATFLIFAILSNKGLAVSHWGWFAAGFGLLCIATGCSVVALWPPLRILPAIWHSAFLAAVCIFLALHLSIQAGINGIEILGSTLVALKAALVFLALLTFTLVIRGVRAWHQWRMSRWFNVPVEKYYGNNLTP